jgi:hypothetical protein
MFITALFACASLLPRGQAVSPAPEGGYPGANTAEGRSALLSLTTGTFNTAVGFLSLKSNATGNFNTGLGAGALLLNTADSNTAIGAGALLSNITGAENTADGAFALLSNTATGNTAVGFRALLNNTTGGTLETVSGVDLGPNVAIGMEALESNTVSSANTAVGYQALHSFNAGIAGFPQYGLNTAIGFQALANTNGANGGSRNSGFGYQAMFHNTDGFENVAIGDQALFANETGFRNTVIGGGALSANTSGNSNTVIGVAAGQQLTTGSGNVCIGAFSDVGSPNDNNTTHIANIGDTPQGGGLPVTVDPSANNQLGYIPSSRRYKEDIEPMDKASEALFAFKPVSFRYKKKVDRAQTRAFGLIAEDVEKVDPNLVARNRQGQPESVRYEYINAMLLNEFLKEHKKVQQLEVNLAQQQKDFRAAIARLKKETELKIQRATAQIELSKPPSRMVVEK